MVLSVDARYKLHIPGALHNARFLAKAIYFLKIFLLMEYVPGLTNDEKREVTEMATFISLFYSEWFLRAEISNIAPAQVNFSLVFQSQAPACSKCKNM